MLKWFAIVIGASAVLVVANYIRWWILPRRRLQRLLLAQGVAFREIRKGGHYGWPGYLVVFDSLEKRRAFQDSPAFGALLREVQSMHGDLKRGPRQFDVNLAVSLAP